MAKDNKIKSVPAVREAAESAGRVVARWNAVETEAARVHEEGQGRNLLRAVAGEDGIHAIIRDKHGATMEIAGGKIAVTIAAKE
jgi:hypothetical protein